MHTLQCKKFRETIGQISVTVEKGCNLIPPGVDILWHIAIIPIQTHEDSVLSFAHDCFAEVPDCRYGLTRSDLIDA